MPNLRVKINERKGLATLAGIDYNVLRQLICCAEIHLHQSLAKNVKTLERKRVSKADKNRANEAMDYERKMLSHAKRLDQSILDGFAATFPKKGPLTKEERFDKVRESEKERKFWEKFYKELWPE